MQMRMVQLPRTDLTVSRLCLGAVNFGAPVPQGDVEAMLDAFLEQGGNFVDTAHVYSDWRIGPRSKSEKMLGKALRRIDRKRLVISTKGGHYNLLRPSVSRVTPKDIVHDLDESLEFLGTDYVDLYFLHRDNEQIPVGELMDCLEEQRRLGKIRHLGCSNWTLPRVKEARMYADKAGIPGFAVNQVMWSLAQINPGSVPADLVLMDEETRRYSAESDMGVMCYTALAKGYFTKRFRGDSLKKSLTDVYANPANDETYTRLAALGDPVRITQACLRFFEDQPLTAIPIVSCGGLEQLSDCMGAFVEE